MATHLPATESPLMSVIEYDHQMFRTVQYFHRQYVSNHPAGKHARLDNFMRLLQGIEAYHFYVENHDIVSLDWAQVKSLPSNSELVNKNNNLKSMFIATGYHPLILLNATAQAALTHHLDDELSKQLSVAINTQAARTAQTQISPLQQAKDDVLSFIELAVLYETPKFVALTEAAKYIQKHYGIDMAPMLQLSAAMDAIPDEQIMLEPTEIGKRLGISGADLNKRLQAAGVQARINGEWTPTDLGREHCYRHAWTVGEKTGFNLKWNVEFVEKLLKGLSPVHTH